MCVCVPNEIKYPSFMRKPKWNSRENNIKQWTIITYIHEITIQCDACHVWVLCIYDVVLFFSRFPLYVCSGSDVGGFLLIYLLLLFMVHVFVCVLFSFYLCFFAIRFTLAFVIFRSVFYEWLCVQYLVLIRITVFIPVYKLQWHQKWTL